MKRYRWLIWICFLVGWTLLLTFPVPEPLSRTSEAFAPGRRWLVAKTVHLTGYATFVILSAWLNVPQRLRPLLMLFLLAHCTATELIQSAFTYRDGNLIDVGVNNVAVMIGVALSWRWWVQKDPV